MRIVLSHSRQKLTRIPDGCKPAISYLQTIYVMVMNTLTDFLLMAIPLPASLSSPLRFWLD